MTRQQEIGVDEPIPQSLLDTVRQASYVVAFTGAGVSAESGIATFRDAGCDGLWSRFDPMQLATADGFRRDPALVWGWYTARRQKVLQARPNPAHVAIAELSRQRPRVEVVTQNVDNLHERAGSDRVTHLHGELLVSRCFECDKPHDHLPGSGEPDEQGRLDPPRCDHCSGPLRPGVVWFGEMLPEEAMNRAYNAALHCDLMVSIGTSGMVYPAAELPKLAHDNGAQVIHVNPERPPVVCERDWCLLGAAGYWLPRLFAEAG
ncbi:NAD-dependent deacylase [Halopseudomonas nanhaiensis]|uniref:SIR2 family NAD-dependent protein deacylase n=1 Tax=Halopseudomonas nanhaiensis TaxID=2830842 RepID=UPI001CC033F9|nr:NAD-dependent deacylase [Halopseudomonas nanhaiensis]UAW99365.1 NAD-dependent deacylase [Halopseudomonas nanhaiensis]